MILVSILGDFHSSIFPVMNKFKDEIKTHVLLYDKNDHMLQKAQRYLNGIENFREKYSLQFDSKSHRIDEYSQLSIESLEKIFKLYTDNFENLYVNVTDGLASINTLLTLKLVPLGARMIAYDKFDNQGSIITNKKVEKLTIVRSLSIQDHFLLRGIRLEPSTDKTILAKYKNEIQRLFREDFTRFNKLRKKGYNHLQDNEHDKIAQTMLELVEAFNAQNKESFITGGLYELYIASLLLDTDIDDVDVGVKIYDKDENLNEFDVLFIKDNHLHMIECKMTKNIDIKELIYQYISLKDLLDNDGKMAILTQNQHDYKLANTIKQKHQLFQRAATNDILVRGSVFENEDKFYKDLEKFFKVKKTK
jgi:hypothetical protein